MKNKFKFSIFCVKRAPKIGGNELKSKKNAPKSKNADSLFQKGNKCLKNGYIFTIFHPCPSNFVHCPN